MTQEQCDALKSKLKHIKEVSLLRAIKETNEYRANGDFSENAEYQIAKGRLRGLLRAVDELQYQITHAQIIQAPSDTATVQIGHTVTVRIGSSELQLQILGSTQANPAAGIISYQSPVGAALLGRMVGDRVTVATSDRTVLYEILAIA
jgi:transcription elongation factor GreA